MPPEQVDRACVHLRKALMKELGATTSVSMKDVEGDTATWGPEAVRLILVVTEEQEKADSVFAAQAGEDGALAEFQQEEIWILRQKVELFRAQFKGQG